MEFAKNDGIFNFQFDKVKFATNCKYVWSKQGVVKQAQRAVKALEAVW